MNLRKEVSGYVARAIDSTINYSGDEYEQNKHNWIEITTDRVLASVMNSLPEPVDVASKYETGPSGGIYINVGNDMDEEHNEQQLSYLATYQADQGYNTYFRDYTDYLKGLYTLPGDVVQSEHEQSEWFHGGEDDNSSDKEPSKVR